MMTFLHPSLTTQILYCFGVDLATSLSRWREGELERPEFTSTCPLCGATSCCRFLGYYRRGVVLENGERIPDFSDSTLPLRATAKASPRLLPRDFFSAAPSAAPV